MEGRDLRRGVTLSEQLSSVDSSNLRDLLKVRDDDEAHHSRHGSITLASVMARESLVSAAAVVGGGASGRTLLDIMQQEQEISGNVVVDDGSGNGINWKAFKDRILLRRAASAWLDAAAAVPSRPDRFSNTGLTAPAPPNPTTLPSSVLGSVPNRNAEPPQQLPTSASDGRDTVSEQHAPRSSLSEPSASRPEIGVGSNNAARSHIGDATLTRTPVALAEEQQSPRMSLMALLEQTDDHWGGSPGGSAAAEVEDETNDEAAEHSGIRMVYVCCVCLVRQKGAAFIPCGHTFCRFCSRELWTNRGSCPLCNRLILEILDIF